MHPAKEDLIKRWKEEYSFNENLISAFGFVKRENFILPEHLAEAYGDHPLPILSGQTISQPTTVMIMIDALDLKPTDNVLEIGAGSGYGAAIISRLAKKVTSIEIIPKLAAFAESNLKKEKIRNVEIIAGDGSIGFKKNSPYDKIIITAACPKIPEELIDQLNEGGIIVAPVGDLFTQVMIKATKKYGKLEEKKIGYFRFVPLKGKKGY